MTKAKVLRGACCTVFPSFPFSSFFFLLSFFLLLFLFPFPFFFSLRAAGAPQNFKIPGGNSDTGTGGMKYRAVILVREAGPASGTGPAAAGRDGTERLPEQLQLLILV
jgi:hypothetical protein